MPPKSVPFCHSSLTHTHTTHPHAHRHTHTHKCQLRSIGHVGCLFRKCPPFNTPRYPPVQYLPFNTPVQYPIEQKAAAYPPGTGGFDTYPFVSQNWSSNCFPSVFHLSPRCFPVVFRMLLPTCHLVVSRLSCKCGLPIVSEFVPDVLS